MTFKTVKPYRKNTNLLFFKNRLQGYSGGFSAESVADELQKLSKVLSSKRKIYIDAENCLKDDHGYLDLQKCKAYIQNALSAVK